MKRAVQALLDNPVAITSYLGGVQAHVSFPLLALAADTSLARKLLPSVFGAVGIPPSAVLNHNQQRCASSFADEDEKMGRPTTPWVRQVISGVDLMRHPKYNKGLAFSEVWWQQQ